MTQTWPNGLKMGEVTEEFDHSLADDFIEGGLASDLAPYPPEAAGLYPDYGALSIATGVLQDQQLVHPEQGYNGVFYGHGPHDPLPLLTTDVGATSHQQVHSTCMEPVGQSWSSHSGVLYGQACNSPVSSNGYSPASSQPMDSATMVGTPVTPCSISFPHTNGFPLSPSKAPAQLNYQPFGTGAVDNFQFRFHSGPSNVNQIDSYDGHKPMMLSLYQKKDFVSVLGCKLCAKDSGRFWGNLLEIEVHAREKHEESAKLCSGFKCPWPTENGGCSEARQSKADICRHADTPHHVSNSDGEKCLYAGCGHIELTVSDMDRHYMEVHRDPRLKIFSCKQPGCARQQSKKFRRVDHLRAHEKTHGVKDMTPSSGESSKRKKAFDSVEPTSKKLRRG